MMVGGAVLAPVPFVLPDDSTAQLVSLVVLAGGGGLVLLLFVSTVLFARPKCVIAPPLRGQRGAIAEWFGIGSDKDERDPRGQRSPDSS